MEFKILEGSVEKQGSNYVLLKDGVTVYEFPSSEDKNGLLAIAHQGKKRARLALGEDGEFFHLKVEGGGKQRDDMEWLTQQGAFPRGKESKFKPSYVIAILSVLALLSLAQASLSLVRTNFFDPGGWGIVISGVLAAGAALYTNFNKRDQEEKKDSL